MGFFPVADRLILFRSLHFDPLPRVFCFERNSQIYEALPLGGLFQIFVLNSAHLVQVDEGSAWNVSAKDGTFQSLIGSRCFT
jgi:hypothetical protein